MQAQVLQKGARVILNSRLLRRLEKNLFTRRTKKETLSVVFQLSEIFFFQRSLNVLRTNFTLNSEQLQNLVVWTRYSFFFCSQQSNLNQSQTLSSRSSYVKSTENTESTLLVALISIFFLSHSLATGSPIFFFVVKIFYSFWVINDNKYIDNKYKLFILPQAVLKEDLLFERLVRFYGLDCTPHSNNLFLTILHSILKSVMQEP